MSSSRYRLHIDRSTSSGNIGLLARKSTDDDLLAPSWRRQKDAKPQIAINPASHVASKPGHQKPPSGSGSNCAGAGALKLKQDQQQRSKLSASIFFVGSPERLAAAAADDVRLIGFGELVKRCALCKAEFDHKKEDEAVHMYRNRPHCSLKCRDARIESDGFTRNQVGLEDKGGDYKATTKPALKRNEKDVRLGIHIPIGSDI